MEQVTPYFFLESLGVGRFDNLLFKCRPDLNGKVTDVKTARILCVKCNQYNISGWEYRQNGEIKQYFVSDICTGCMRGQDTKRFTSEVEASRKRSIEDTWYHISPNDKSGFKSYVPTNKVTKKALNKAEDYTRRLLKSEFLNLVMLGNPGTGKSHLAKTIAKTYKHKGLSVAYINAVDLFDLLKKTFGNERHKWMFYQQYTDFDLVVVDDVGLETRKLGEVSWSVSEWTRLIDAREGKATVYTSNLDDNSLSNVIGTRAKSRMNYNAMFIDLFTEDYRKNSRVI